jgi:hypothetical protein
MFAIDRKKLFVIGGAIVVASGFLGPSIYWSISDVPIHLEHSISPFPSALVLMKGLQYSSTNPALPWGVAIPQSQIKNVKVRNSGSHVSWGVWDKEAAQFPVRSVDRGLHWEAAGPQLANDWAGGSLFYVTKVFYESPTSVVMVSNYVVDVTVDAGHTWYQYLNSSGYSWAIVKRDGRYGRIDLYVSLANYRHSQLDHAKYELQLSRKLYFLKSEK